MAAMPCASRLKRQEYLKALLGPAAEEEMRLTRIPAADLRREPALLMDAIKAVGFFPVRARHLLKVRLNWSPRPSSKRWRTGRQVTHKLL